MVINVKYWLLVLAALKKLLPVAKEVAAAAIDGKITKEEVLVIVENAMGEHETIYLWGKPNA